MDVSCPHLLLKWIYSQIKEKRRGNREEVEVVLERHEQRIKALERDMSAMKEVQVEIRSMNETLVTLATELKHTNEHLARHERKIDEIDNVPKQRIQQIITAIIAALSGGLISTMIGLILI